MFCPPPPWPAYDAFYFFPLVLDQEGVLHPPSATIGGYFSSQSDINFGRFALSVKALFFSTLR